MRKFLRFFPEGFRDETYLDWERRYKLRAHEEWQLVLNRTAYQSKLSQSDFLSSLLESCQIQPRRRSRIGAEAVFHKVERAPVFAL